MRGLPYLGLSLGGAAAASGMALHARVEPYHPLTYLYLYLFPLALAALLAGLIQWVRAQRRG